MIGDFNASRALMQFAGGSIQRKGTKLVPGRDGGLLLRDPTANGASLPRATIPVIRTHTQAAGFEQAYGIRLSRTNNPTDSAS